MNVGHIHRIRKRDQSRSDNGDGDVWLGKFAKFIPGEALIIYPIGKAGSSESLLPYWPLIVVLVIVILRFFTISGGDWKKKLLSILISIVAFTCWVLANGDQFGPITPNFPHAEEITIWGGLFWLAIASTFFKGD